MLAEVTTDHGFITSINDEDVLWVGKNMCVYLKTLYILYIACFMV